MLVDSIVKSSVSFKLIYDSINCIAFHYNLVFLLVNQLKSASKEFDLEPQVELATAVIV